MRRSFSILQTLGSKSRGHGAELSKELRTTLRYLGREPSLLSSLLSRERVEEEHVVELLNRGLPDAKSGQERVGEHYAQLLGRLGRAVEQHEARGTLAEQVRTCGTDGAALVALLEHAVADGAGPREMAQVVLSAHFGAAQARAAVGAVGRCATHGADLALLLCYRARERVWYEQWRGRWLAGYGELHSLSQKMLWRTMVALEDMAAVNAGLESLGALCDARQVVMVHQVLHAHAHLLTPALLEVSLARNQLLFCKAMRLLAGHASARSTRWAAALVRASISHKLAVDMTAPGAVSVQQYAFASAMHDVLAAVADGSPDSHLRDGAGALLRELHRADGEKPQPVLNFLS
ncbi:ACR245Cp [Eremothecium gossypii ATCC 10895]|uniref:ACR245Cp n=1 Tax=Eremothecium gossypii (strain ATCC 10895 / CBS 109.51 / FGSC 9923 / NRRL Y-1056) TaxID=284811 RepID=Q75BM6_EREGS|nr:ACR245Cp [Eremothecium gossypii ATCC 10895]AAS51471.2 ACR245Cp [Eremothecium gossypii ATCC 10895]AEY95762.1 FACR245Cp [Eremothecium gossypii FDAG1]